MATSKQNTQIAQVIFTIILSVVLMLLLLVLPAEALTESSCDAATFDDCGRGGCNDHRWNPLLNSCKKACKTFGRACPARCVATGSSSFAYACNENCSMHESREHCVEEEDRQCMWAGGSCRIACNRYYSNESPNPICPTSHCVSGKHGCNPNCTMLTTDECRNYPDTCKVHKKRSCQQICQTLPRELCSTMPHCVVEGMDCIPKCSLHSATECSLTKGCQYANGACVTSCDSRTRAQCGNSEICLLGFIGCFSNCTAARPIDCGLTDGPYDHCRWDPQSGSCVLACKKFGARECPAGCIKSGTSLPGLACNENCSLRTNAESCLFGDSGQCTWAGGSCRISCINYYSDRNPNPLCPASHCIGLDYGCNPNCTMLTTTECANYRGVCEVDAEGGCRQQCQTLPTWLCSTAAHCILEGNICLPRCSLLTDAECSLKKSCQYGNGACIRACSSLSEAGRCRSNDGCFWSSRCFSNCTAARPIDCGLTDGPYDHCRWDPQSSSCVVACKKFGGQDCPAGCINTGSSVPAFACNENCSLRKNPETCLAQKGGQCTWAGGSCKISCSNYYTDRNPNPICPTSHCIGLGKDCYPNCTMVSAADCAWFGNACELEAHGGCRQRCQTLPAWLCSTAGPRCVVEENKCLPNCSMLSGAECSGANMCEDHYGTCIRCASCLMGPILE